MQNIHPRQADETPPSSASIRSSLFGSAELLNVYRSSRQLIFSQRLMVLAEYAETEGGPQLTICNIWRIRRSQNRSLKLSERCLVSGTWRNVRKTKGWPDVPFFGGYLDWWRAIIGLVVDRALEASGHLFVRHMGSLRQVLLRTLIGRAGKKWRPGLLNHDSMRGMAKQLRALLYRKFIDKQVLSGCQLISYRDEGLRRYLQYSSNASAFAKIVAERRNLIPLLPHIRRQFWSRTDLFSRNNWVSPAGEPTIVDSRGFTSSRTSLPGSRTMLFKSFTSHAAWRWLSAASVVVVREWIENGCPTHLVTNLALCNLRARGPSIEQQQTILFLRT